MAKPLAEISKCWPTRIILRLLAANLSTTANQLSATSVLIQQKPAWRLQTKWYGKLCRSIVVQGPDKVGTESFFCECRFFFQNITRTNVWQFWLDVWHVKVCFLFGAKENFKLRNLPSKTSTLFLSRRSACLFFWTTATTSATILKNFEVNLSLHFTHCAQGKYVIERKFMYL